MAAKKLIVGISGASGAIYGIRMLEVLKQLKIETHLVISKAAQLTIGQETDYSLKQVQALAAKNYAAGDIAAVISSGSFKTMGMVIAPCSIRTMSEIATGFTGTLMSRAADVVLKERRRLVLMVRETPLHAGHLRTMAHLAEIGAIIAPPVPAFYNRPASLAAVVDHSIGRVLDLFDIEHDLLSRWKGMKTKALD
jgi:flavin prenyltransferase